MGTTTSRTSGLTRRGLSMLASGALGVTLSVTGASPAPAAPASLGSAIELAPTLRAKATGQAVPVPELTTETTEVSAMPDGTFSAVINSVPVRVKRGIEWAPLDATLTRGQDGRIRSKASPTDVSLSSGGAGPLVIATDGARSISTTWPDPLPEPTLAGSTATYRNVLPDVDLVVTATPNGFKDVLVVKNAAAAANPRLATISASQALTGVSASASADGSITYTDTTSGETAFVAPQPVMWDSRTDPKAGGKATADNPGGAATEVLAAQVNPKKGSPGVVETTLKPKAGWISHRDRQFPLYLDPVTTTGRATTVVVTSDGRPPVVNGSGSLSVGLCGTTGCGGQWVARSFVSFDTSFLSWRTSSYPTARTDNKAVVTAASVSATQTWNAAGCTATPVVLNKAAAIGSSTTWPGPAFSALETASSGAGGACPAAKVSFGSAAVAQYVSDSATTNASKVAFGLTSPSETNASYWKRFDPNVTLQVTYAFRPTAAADLTVTNASAQCGTEKVINTPQPRLQAKASDNNQSPTSSGLPIAFGYEIDKIDGATPQRVSASGAVSSSTTPGGPGVYVGSGTYAAPGQDSWVPWGDAAHTYSGPTTSSPVPLEAGKIMLADGRYRFRVTTRNSAGLDAVAASDYAYFTVDTRTAGDLSDTKIWSVDYPQGTSSTGAPSNVGGAMTVHTNANRGVIYSISTASSDPTLPVPTGCPAEGLNSLGVGINVKYVDGQGNATIAIPKDLAPGFHTLHVRPFNRNNSAPTITDYQFRVGDPRPGATTGADRQDLDALTGTPSGVFALKVAATNATSSLIQSGEVNAFSAMGGKAISYQPKVAANDLSVTYTFTTPNQPALPGSPAGTFTPQLAFFGPTGCATGVSFAVDGQPFIDLNASLDPIKIDTCTVRNQQLFDGLAPGTQHTLTVNNNHTGSITVDYLRLVYRPGTPTSQALMAVAPTRLVDTRSGTSANPSLATAVGANKTITIKLAGAGTPLPTGATQAFVNVTVTSATASGIIVGSGSNPFVHFGPGVTTANHSVLTLNAAGTTTLTNASSGTVQVMVDVQGYAFTDNVGTGNYWDRSSAKVRVADTSTGTTLNPRTTPLSPGESATFTVTDVPDASAAALRVTAVGGAADRKSVV